MKAMILAAGKGTRVRPLTTIMPKPMIPLVRKPVMECIVEHLARHGFDEIVVNTSYLSSAIESYFRDGAQWGVKIAYSYEGEIENGAFVDRPIGSAGGMKKIQEFSGFFDDSFVVVCGDALIDVDFTEVLRIHKEKKAIATIVMKEVPLEEVPKYGVVVTDADGRIQRFQEKPAMAEAASRMINTGIYIFEPDVFDFIPPDQEFDIGGELFPRLVAAGQPFYGVSLPFQWVDIGSLPDFWTANRLILSGGVSGFEMPGTEIAPGIWCGINVRMNLEKVNLKGPLYIGSSSSIGDGVSITGPAMIGANCEIGSGAQISEGIVSDYTRVDGNASLEQCIIFAGRCINPDGSVLDLEEAGMTWLIDDSRKKSLLDEESAALRELLADITPPERKIA